MNASAKALVNLQALEFAPVEEHQQVVADETTIRRLRARISGDLLRKNEIRKPRYGATSVVPVRRGTCSGCQISVSLRTRRSADQAITECEHCARLVYASSPRRKRLRIEI